jgi:hypothetical protein
VSSSFVLCERGGDPPADGVISPCEIPGIVGVQTLDTAFGSGDAAVGAGTFVVFGERGVSFRRVTRVGAEQFLGLDRSFGGAYTARRLDPSDTCDEDPIDEPVPGRHRRPVVELGRVTDHDRRARVVADGDFERAARRSTEQDREGNEVGIGG